MSLGHTFQERYINFFKYFDDSPRSLEEINNFIQDNKIPSFSTINRINLNMIDPQNLNILFHIIRKSISDNDCLEKIKLLIEKYHVKYNLFDYKHHRTLPYYTCVKGYLDSTKYLIEKMNYKIEIFDVKQESLFFSAMRSYNIDLVKYLDEKYPQWIFYPNNEFNSCIYYIFKDSLKKESEEKIKILLKFIIEKGFDIEERNNDNFSFKDLCSQYGINNYLDDVLKSFNIQKIENIENNQKLENINDINENKSNILEENFNKEKINESVISKLNCNQLNFNIDESQKNVKDEKIESENFQIENNKGTDLNIIKMKSNFDSDKSFITLNNISINCSSIDKNKINDDASSLINDKKSNDLMISQISCESFLSNFSDKYEKNFENKEKREKQICLDTINKKDKPLKCCFFYVQNNVNIEEEQKKIDKNSLYIKHKDEIIRSLFLKNQNLLIDMNIKEK